ncbi:MAG: cation:proton antiporter [Marinobacter sp.]
MKDLNLSLALVGACVLLMSLFTRPLQRSWLSLPLLAFLVGVVAGPIGYGWLDVARWGDEHLIMEQVARLTLGISLMGIALRLPPRYLVDHRRSITTLLLLAMPLLCLTSSAVSYASLDIAPLAALAVGATVCATDPVAASSIVTGGVAKDNLPQRFRHTLSAESALNDGLALPLAMIPVLLMTRTVEAAASEWLWQVLVWKVGAAALLGIVLGLAVGRLLRFAERRQLIDQPSFLTVTLALTLLALGGGKLLGTDGLLVVFLAGVAFDQEVRGSDRAQEARVQEAVNLFFTLPVFMLFGLMAPVDHWRALGWGGVALVAGILLLRRLPVILLLRPLIPDWKPWSTAALAGWFGPIGIAALYYGLFIQRETGTEVTWIAGSLLVAASLVAHGVTASPLGRWYGRSKGTP